MYQTTLNNTVSFEGIGLHSGKHIKVHVHPAFPDTGIQFRRSDIKSSEYTKASPYTVSSTQLATTINCNGGQISTIEHLMSALYGLGIDNAMVEVDGFEVPILDGSANPIVNLLYGAGIKKLNKKRKYIKFKKRIRLEREDKWIELIPSRFFKVTFDINFDDDFVGQQKAYFEVTRDSFSNEIANARTFGFKKDVDALHSMGLAKGGSLDNAVVIDGNQILNEDGLRHKDEFVRHKILDLIGDISLVGYRFFGHIRAYKSGHLLNNIFAKILLESNYCYNMIELEDDKEPEIILQRELNPQII